jgi:hypothetical protein
MHMRPGAAAVERATHAGGLRTDHIFAPGLPAVAETAFAQKDACVHASGCCWIFFEIVQPFSEWWLELDILGSVGGRSCFVAEGDNRSTSQYQAKADCHGSTPGVAHCCGWLAARCWLQLLLLATRLASCCWRLRPAAAGCWLLAAAAMLLQCMLQAVRCW